MENKDKNLEEALAIMKISPDNPLIKDKKKLMKLKLELAKALIEAGHNLA